MINKYVSASANEAHIDFESEINSVKELKCHFRRSFPP